jgi:hypothetical protein
MVSLEVGNNTIYNLEVLDDVVLSFPDGGPNAASVVLGDLSRCRVAILNDNMFPNGDVASDRGNIAVNLACRTHLSPPIRTKLSAFTGETRRGNEMAVIKAFAIHNYKLFKKDTHWALFWRTAPGLTFVIGQLITQDVIKTVSSDYSSESQLRLVIIGVIYFFNFLLGYYCDVEFSKLRLSGKASNVRVLVGLIS